MTGFLLIEQHFLPLFFGKDLNLLNYEIYQDFKEEFNLLSYSHPKKGMNKIFNDIKKLTKIKKKKSLQYSTNDDEQEEIDIPIPPANVFKSALTIQQQQDTGLENDNSALIDDNDAEGTEDEEEDAGQVQDDFIKGNATLKDVQEMLTNSEVFSMNFSHHKKLTLILTNGTIIHVIMKNIFTHEYIYNVNQIFHFDDPYSSVAYGHHFVLFLFPENKLIVARKNLPPHQEEMTFDLEDHKKKGKNVRKVDIATFTELLPKQSLKKLNKKIILNHSCNLFLVWWTSSKTDVFPWTPRPEDRANIIIYGFDETEPVLLYSIKTENNLLFVNFVGNSDEVDDVLILETVSNTNTGQTSVKETIFQLFEDGTTKALAETTIPIQSTITCFAYNQNHQKLAIGCFDTSIVVHSKKGKITHCKKCTFIPAALSWHPDSCLLVVIGDQGQFQIYDIVLTPILLSSVRKSSPSLTQEFIPSTSTDFLKWASISSTHDNSFLLMRTRSGEISFLRITVGRMKLVNLIRLYLVHNHITEAIHVLKNVQWNSEHCLESIYAIFGELIKKNHSEAVEAQLEYLLTTYFVSTVEPDPGIYKKHLYPVCLIARRFFMWLIRAKRFDRALQVAISLRNNSLLQHLRKVAEVSGAFDLAEQADKSIRSDYSSDGGSSTSGSESEHSSDSEGSDYSCSTCSGSESYTGSSSYTSDEENSSGSPENQRNSNAKRQQQPLDSQKSLRTSITEEQEAGPSSRRSSRGTLFTIKEEQVETFEQTPASISSLQRLDLEDLINRNEIEDNRKNKITVVHFGAV